MSHRLSVPTRTKVTESLYAFDSVLDLDAFIAALRAAVDGDDSVYVIYLGKNGLRERKVVDGS